MKKDTYEIIDNKGTVRQDGIFSAVERSLLRTDHYIVKNENGYGIMNEVGKFIIPCQYEGLTVFGHQYYRARDTTGVVHFLNPNCEELFTVEYEGVYGFPPNGYITHPMHKVSKGKEDVQYFYNGGYINYSMPFKSIHPISTNGFIVEEDKQHGIYSYEGDTIAPVEYHELKVVRSKFQVRFFNSFGYFDQDGKSLFDPKTGK